MLSKYEGVPKNSKRYWRAIGSSRQQGHIHHLFYQISIATHKREISYQAHRGNGSNKISLLWSSSQSLHQDYFWIVHGAEEPL